MNVPFQSSGTQPAINAQQTHTQGLDAKSDASFDPLFDDEPDADGEVDDINSPIQPTKPSMASQLSTPSNPNAALELATPDGTQTFQSQPSARATNGTVAPPKNAPPLLDPTMYATYSSDLLMTAAIDGQVILWDKRVQTTGKGVGRLWMSEKTPPWCLSVRFCKPN
jgi:transcriptional activator SPT8